MPQGPEHAPQSLADQDLADRLAGWDVDRYGPAPNEHGLPVDGLEVRDTPPPVTSW